MISKDIQKLPKSIVEIQITAPWVDIAAKWNESVQRVSSELELPGFRKGQAPLEMVEQRSAQQIQQDFLKNVMPQTLVEALNGTEIVPIDYPQYQIVTFTKGSDLVFKARVTARPIVALGNYKVVKASKPAIKPVTDQEIDQIIADLYKRYQSRAPFSPSVEAQANPPIVPATPGTGGSVNFNQPGGVSFNPQPAQPAPQPVSSTQPSSTEPDDNFAKAMGADSLVDLRRKVKEDLEAEAKYNNELDYEENILQEVEKITNVELPEILIQDELNRMLVSLQRRVADMGLLLEDYLRNQGKTLEQIKGEWQPQAEKNVRMELGLSEIARLENVDISDPELQAEIDKIQDAKLKQQFDQQEPRMHLRHALRQTKTLNLLKTVVG